MKPALAQKTPLDLADELIFMMANLAIYAGDFKFVRHWRRRMKRWPRIACPELYSERMLWRKLVDHNPLFTVFSDKLLCKDYVRRLCPELPQPRTLWIGMDVDDIPEEFFRGDVFVKTNHGCGFNYRVRNGNFDREDLRRKTRAWLAQAHGHPERQWAYSGVKPVLFVEEAVGDVERGLLDFNIRASNGRPILGSVIGLCKVPGQWTAYFDAEGNQAPAWNDADDSAIKPLPGGLDIREPYLRAVEYARRLSAGVDYARYDFLWNGKELYGGEITVYPAAGVHDSANHWSNATVLNGWDLRQSHFLTTRQTGWKNIYANALQRRLAKSLPLPLIRPSS